MGKRKQLKDSDNSLLGDVVEEEIRLEGGQVDSICNIHNRVNIPFILLDLNTFKYIYFYKVADTKQHRRRLNIPASSHGHESIKTELNSLYTCIKHKIN